MFSSSTFIIWNHFMSDFSSLKRFNFVTGSFLLLFQMGHLAFSRLYYHNMTQDLKVHVLF